MPTHDCLGPDQLNHVKQIRPEPDHPDQQEPIDAAQPNPPGRLSQCNVQLVTKKQILDFKSAAGLEQVGDKRCEPISIGNIAFNDAIILPCGANPDRMKFSKGTGALTVAKHRRRLLDGGFIVHTEPRQTFVLYLRRT